MRCKYMLSLPAEASAESKIKASIKSVFMKNLFMASVTFLKLSKGYV